MKAAQLQAILENHLITGCGYIARISYNEPFFRILDKKFNPIIKIKTSNYFNLIEMKVFVKQSFSKNEETFLFKGFAKEETNETS